MSRICKAIIFAQEHGYYDDELAKAVKITVSETFMDNIECAKEIVKAMKPGTIYLTRDICTLIDSNNISIPGYLSRAEYEDRYRHSRYTYIADYKEYIKDKVAAIMRNGATVGVFNGFRIGIEKSVLCYSLA